MHSEMLLVQLNTLGNLLQPAKSVKNRGVRFGSDFFSEHMHYVFTSCVLQFEILYMFDSPLLLMLQCFWLMFGLVVD